MFTPRFSSHNSVQDRRRQRLCTLPRPLALFFRTDLDPVVSRNLSHGPTEHFRLTRTLDTSDKAALRTSPLPQKVRPNPCLVLDSARVHIRGQCDLAFIKRLGGLQPDRPPRIVQILWSCSFLLVLILFGQLRYCYCMLDHQRTRSSVNTAMPSCPMIIVT